MGHAAKSQQKGTKEEIFQHHLYCSQMSFEWGHWFQMKKNLLQLQSTQMDYKIRKCKEDKILFFFNTFLLLYVKIQVLSSRQREV